MRFLVYYPVMTGGQGGVGGARCYPWRARIENGQRDVRGAGILLDSRHVLTCAHVATAEHGGDPELRNWAPANDLFVRFDEYPEHPAVPAEIVVSWGMSGDRNDETGDVAVIELGAPVTGVPRPVLKRTWRLGQDVRIFGVPSGVPFGEWVSASVAGPSSHPDRWVQLEVRSRARVEEGFSGAAVIDQATGDVIGMVVAVDKKDDGVTCWMIDVGVIRRYAPLVGDCVAGSTSVDRAFLRDAPVQAGNAVVTALTRALGDWLTAGGPGGVCVLEGGPASGRAAVLAGLVALMDQEYRAGSDAYLAAPIPVSAPGSVDVAVDATGKTSAEVSRQIGAGLSIPADDPAKLIGRLAEIGPPVGVVVDAIDAAAQPEALPRDLAEPLARAAERHGIRLLLGFREQPPPALRSAVTVRLPDLPPGDAGAISAQTPDGLTAAEVEHRLASLARLINDAKQAEDGARHRHEHVARRVSGVAPLPPASGTALDIRLAMTRILARSGDAAARVCVTAWLDAGEHAGRETLSWAKNLVSELGALMGRRDELRGLLRSYAAMAGDNGLVEDPGLGALYARAWDRLWRAPCDLDAAERAVWRYVRELQRRLGRDG